MESAILIVDDDTNILSALKRSLADEGYEILTAGGGADGLSILRKHTVKVVVSDEMMPGMSGSEFLSEVNRELPGVVRIILTGHANVASAMRAINNGEIYRFLTKPWDDNDLKLVLRTAIEKHDLEAENRRLISTVKRQALSLRILERRHPGITKLDRDDQGNLVIPEIEGDEISEIVAQIERDLG